MTNWDDEGVLDLMISAMRIEADGVLSLELVDPEGGILPAWTPGAHIDVGLPDVVRQYSLCGDPADRDRYVVGVLAEPQSRGGSSYVHEEARPGDLVEVGGPRNHFELVPAKRYLFIAGGIGITPILPMIRQAEAERVPWRLVYGGRTRSSMAFRDLLAAHGDRVLIQPEDETGRLDIAAILADPEEGTAVYCCGPTGLIDAVEGACEAWPAGALNVERFAGKDLSGLVSAPVKVRCAKSDVTVDVAADESILDALETVGISVANACRDGVCGSCEVRVLQGEPDHRDSFRAPGDSDVAALAVCVSRARTPELVLDI
ncbi:PDR/VanB family oxidoreductase [Nocardioides carbamazepini]|uniref:PDR/VanB family oxidoreductase n=1 Tax=Nocardioides carbamazepini TaxID=2854259 RepID=UPI002149E83F|nr:PDR/VanB family oxidoreductase [Nocardioides carbamazepini]MCR1784403.1 PDR/VanB family oxidoreductase [Nocardioides carbamazepini]